MSDTPEEAAAHGYLPPPSDTAAADYVLKQFQEQPWFKTWQDSEDLTGLGCNAETAMRLYEAALAYRDVAYGKSGAVDQHHWKRRAMRYLQRVVELERA